MDLIICVLGLLALIVEGIRCQGVYGECVQFAHAETKCDHDLVKQWPLINRHLFPLDSQGPVIKERKKKKKKKTPLNINSCKGGKPGLNVMFEWEAPNVLSNPEVIQQIACVANQAQPPFSSNPSLMMVGEQAKFSIVHS